MSQKQISITTRVMVTMYVTASDDGGDIEVVSVQRVSPPTPTEVMEALDGNGDLGQLDEAFQAAP